MGDKAERDETKQNAGFKFVENKNAGTMLRFLPALRLTCAATFWPNR